MSSDHTCIDAWIRHLVPDLRRIAGQLGERIRAMAPGLGYGIKWKTAYYGLPDHGCLIEIAPYDVSVNVVFFGGADFNPPPPLGTTDRRRYVKVTTFEVADQPDLKEWIEQAVQTPGWK